MTRCITALGVLGLYLPVSLVGCFPAWGHLCAASAYNARSRQSMTVFTTSLSDRIGRKWRVFT